jgi:hypothetical protein
VADEPAFAFIGGVFDVEGSASRVEIESVEVQVFEVFHAA